MKSCFNLNEVTEIKKDKIWQIKGIPSPRNLFLLKWLMSILFVLIIVTGLRPETILWEAICISHCVRLLRKRYLDPWLIVTQPLGRRRHHFILLGTIHILFLFLLLFRLFLWLTTSHHNNYNLSKRPIE